MGAIICGGLKDLNQCEFIPKGWSLMDQRANDESTLK